MIIGKGLLGKLKTIIKNSDNISKRPSERMFKLKEILIQNNLIMQVDFQLDFILPKLFLDIDLR